ncbi:MAG: glycosyltransferase family 4 protein [Clostridium sp.]
MKIKALEIISGNDNGGGGEHVLNILKGNNSSLTTSICLLGEGDLVKKCKDRKVDFKYFQNKLKNEELIEHINNNNFDIINFHGARGALFHMINKRKIKSKSCITIHSDFNRDFDNLKGFKRLLWSKLFFMSLKSFNNFLVVSDYLGDLLRKHNLCEEVDAVYNGIDVEELSKDIEKETKEREAFTFISISRFHPIKNHRNMILGFNELIKEEKRAKLILVGDGDELQEAKNLVNKLSINDNVEFLGHIDKGYKLFNNVDINVLTSFDEGGIPPLAVLEGFVFSKTVIISKLHNVSDFLGENVFYIDPDNYQSIYKGMKSAVLDCELKTKGDTVRKIVAKEFTIDNFVNRYYEGYKNILNKR